MFRYVRRPGVRSRGGSIISGMVLEQGAAAGCEVVDLSRNYLLQNVLSIHYGRIQVTRQVYHGDSRYSIRAQVFTADLDVLFLYRGIFIYFIFSRHLFLFASELRVSSFTVHLEICTRIPKSPRLINNTFT